VMPGLPQPSPHPPPIQPPSRDRTGEPSAATTAPHSSVVVENHASSGAVALVSSSFSAPSLESSLESDGSSSGITTLFKYVIYVNC
jgi:hypothetical protein